MQLVSEFPGVAEDSASMNAPASLSVMETVPVAKELPALEVESMKDAAVNPTARVATAAATTTATSMGRRITSPSHRLGEEFHGHRRNVPLVSTRCLG